MNHSALFRMLIGFSIFASFFLFSCEEEGGIYQGMDALIGPVHEARSIADGLIEALCDELAEGQEPCELTVGEYEIDGYTVEVREKKKFMMITMNDLSGVTALRMKLKSIDEWMVSASVYIDFPVIQDFYPMEGEDPEKLSLSINSTNPKGDIKTSLIMTGTDSKVACDVHEKGDIIHISSTLWRESDIIFEIQSFIFNIIADTANETTIVNLALTDGDLDEGAMGSVFEEYSPSAVVSTSVTEHILPDLFVEIPDLAEACEGAEDLLACTISWLERHMLDPVPPGSPSYVDTYDLLMGVEGIVASYMNPAFYIEEFGTENFYGAGDKTCPSPPELEGFDELCEMYANGMLDEVAYTPAELGALILVP